ncbi:MAG TPA: hypothetical protein VMV69_02670 [Pirellulales bacterium]|nr:hypothetical protein [Pirellulales bacterium]
MHDCNEITPSTDPGRLRARPRGGRFAARRRGYVLLMALGTVALAGFLLAGVARHSLLAALTALDAREDLQRRWGAVSCRHAFLDQAETILASLEPDGPNRGVSNACVALRVRLALGGQTFDLRLADENAKVNLNTVLACRGKEQLLRVCRDLPAPAGALRAELGGALTDAGRDGRRALESWGQVFALAGKNGDAIAPAMVAEATLGVTCWGDGRLNIRIATDDRVNAVARLVASANAARELVNTRRRHPAWKLADWLRSLTLGPRERERFARLFTEQTGCHSLWLHVTAGESSWHEFVIAETSTRGERRLSTFVW